MNGFNLVELSRPDLDEKCFDLPSSGTIKGFVRTITGLKCCIEYSYFYFCRLTFPCEVIEDGRASAQYDIDKGTYTFVIIVEQHS